MEDNLKCPFQPIDISSDREIVECDSIKFPWKQDSNGYFLIKIENCQICCGFVNSNHKLIIELRGRNPDNIIKEIAKRKLCDLEHMGYVSSELMIAKDCLENKKKYIQR